MGQILSEPVTQKETSRCENEKMVVGSSSMQGWRINMEDAHTTILSLAEDTAASFFAVFDGHGSEKVSQYAGKHLHKIIVGRPEYNNDDIENAIMQGFLEIDTDMLEDEELKDEMAGTTAITVLLRNNLLYCGNVGDSRAIASCKGTVVALSEDHKPNNPGERQRITEAGGWVELNRVNGNLALSRALGDFMFKKNPQKNAMEQIVTAYPEVLCVEVDDDWEFIVLACDGIWDVLQSHEVMAFVRQRLAEKKEPESICEDLMTRCLAPDSSLGGLGCDNMTVVIVCLTNGLSWPEFCEKCSRPAAALPENDQTQSSQAEDI